MQKTLSSSTYALKWSAPAEVSERYTAILVNCSDAKTSQSLFANTPMTGTTLYTNITGIVAGVTYDCEAVFKMNERNEFYKFSLGIPAPVETKTAGELVPGKGSVG